MDSNDKRSELLRALGDRVDSLTSSEGWKAWLHTASRFRSYSVRNQLLIALQCPNATKVAGYRVWQGLGRQVCRGERAIAILAPCVSKVVDADTGDRRSVLTGFRTASVFDISQTSGEPLPELVMPAVTVADGALYARLLCVAEQDGITVKTVDCDSSGARGWFQRDELSITIVVAGFDIGSRTRTLLHELSHASDHLDDVAHFETSSRAEKEIIAESVAYLVGTAFAVEMAEASSTYIASWRGEAGALEHVAQRILKLAANFEAAISASDTHRVAA